MATKENLFLNLGHYLYLQQFIIPKQRATNEPQDVKQEATPEMNEEQPKTEPRQEKNILLHAIYENPIRTSTKLYEKAGISLGLGHKLKQELVEAELVEEITAIIRKGRGGTGKILWLTDKAYQLMNLPKPYLGKGGSLHRFWMLVIKQHFGKQGYKVEIEHPVGTAGSSIDLMAKKDRIVVVEIALQKANLEETIEKLKKVKADEKVIGFHTEKEARGFDAPGITGRALFEFYQDHE